METLTVAGVTEVIVSEGLPRPVLPPRRSRAGVMILTQPKISSLAYELATELDRSGTSSNVYELPDGEEAKTLEVAERVYSVLADVGITRHDSIVGVGGGTVTDLAGFVAGTWLRGIEVVHLPTTLLGAVDASIGGKTGVNLAGKNLVGVFWHPTRVLVDLTVLRQLPRALRQEGFSEAFKAGLVGDPALADLFVSKGLEAPIDQVVTRAIGVKARIVDADERESDVRAFLNFGHTFGHAVEFATTYTHGESVAIGMVAAAAISKETRGFEGSDLVMRTLDKLALPTCPPSDIRERVLELLHFDKKKDERGIRMVLLDDIGVPVVQHVSDEELEIGLDALGL